MSTRSEDRYDDVVDQNPDHRRHEMYVALRWAAVLSFGFVLVTLDVINQGLLYRFDQYFADINRPKLTGFANFFILRVDAQLEILQPSQSRHNMDREHLHSYE